MAKTKRDKVTMRAVGERLARTREAFEKTQVEIAELIEISPQRLNNYERGLRPLDIDVAIPLVERWKGVTLDWIYRGDDSGLPRRVAEAIARQPARRGRRRGVTEDAD